MNQFKKLASIIMAFVLVISFLPQFSMRIFAAPVPSVGVYQIFANGVPIFVEAGKQDPSKTMIRYGDNQYLDLQPFVYGDQFELDLSDFEVFGGSEDSSVADTSIVMTGGNVRLLLGGGLRQNVTGDVNISVSGDAKISSLYGGGHSNASVEGKVTVNISGGIIDKTVCGSGTENSPVKETFINITGGKIMGDIYGGGLKNSPVKGEARIAVSNDAQVADILGGGNINSVVQGSASINLTDNVIAKNIYGGGFRKSHIEKNVSISISGNAKVVNVYGGGTYYDGNEISIVRGNAGITVTGSSIILGAVNGDGEKSVNSVMGIKEGIITSAVKTEKDSFTNLLGKDENSNWHIKGNVVLEEDKSIIIEKGKNLTIPKNSILTLDGVIINQGTLNIGGDLQGSGSLNGNGDFHTVADDLSEDDIRVPQSYTYTGKKITPEHKIHKTIPFLNKEFEISNWQFEAFDPAVVEEAGEYTLIYKKANEDVRVRKTFQVVPAEQGGSISLDVDDRNQDGKLNVGDILSVNPIKLNPVGGKPNYLWKKEQDNVITELGKLESYIIQPEDLGAEIFCTVHFSGNTNGTLDTDKVLPKLPAPVIDFPAASEIHYGQKLSDSMLIGGSVQYGSFAWKEPDTMPTVNNGGYEVEFEADSQTLAKYEEITTVSQNVVVKVLPVTQKGSIRLIRQDVNQDGKVNAGDILSVDMTALHPLGGTPSYVWKKKAGNLVEPIATTETYTIPSGDEGAEIYCTVEFTGNTEGSLDTDTVVAKLPAAVIVFPTATAIVEGQKLKDSMLKGGSTEYGSFAWSNPDIVASIDNTGYEVLFTPNQEAIAKYEEMKRFTKKIEVAVSKKEFIVLPSYVFEEQTKEAKKEKQAQKPEKKIPFTDVKPEDYFADAVLWALENGIAKGTTEDTFSPYAISSRAEMISFLWRAAGSPVVTEAIPFQDVAADEYYSEAVRWAVKNNLVRGTSADRFHPSLSGTRAQIITLLYRYAGSPQTTENIRFHDVEADAYYAKAVIWAVEKGITKGTDENSFSPNVECDRAQIITFLYRLHQ